MHEMAVTPSTAAPKPAVQLRVPGDASGRPGVQYTHFTRLGGVVPEEAALQQDPAATGSAALPIGTAFPVAFNPGALTYTQGTIQAVAPQAYLRLGNTAGYDTWLQTDPDAALATVAPPAAPPNSPAFNSHGALLHSTDAIDLFAPLINQTAKTLTTNTDVRTDFTSDTLATLFNGSQIASITRVAPDSTGILSTSSVQVADNYATLIGSALSTIAGSSATAWTGNDASTGVGSLLWSNCGTTQNVFGGQVVNILNGGIDVQGFGEAKLTDFSVVAPTSIKLAVSPLVAMQVTANSVITVITALNGVIAAAASVLAIAAAATPTSGANDRDSAALRSRMNDYQQEMRTVLALVFAVQILAIVAGRVATVAATAAGALPMARIVMDPLEIVLSAGGTTVTIGPMGFKVVTPVSIDLKSMIVNTAAANIAFSAPIP